LSSKRDQLWALFTSNKPNFSSKFFFKFDHSQKVFMLFSKNKKTIRPIRVAQRRIWFDCVVKSGVGGKAISHRILNTRNYQLNEISFKNGRSPFRPVYVFGVF
jgi:hypothetical protein